MGGGDLRDTGVVMDVSCSCARCKAMCETSCCLPTPDEARVLIRAGYGDRLATYIFAPDAQQCVGPAPAGREGGKNLIHTKGRCTFFDGEHCELHALGLKPREGRRSLHDKHWMPVRLEVLSHWRGRKFDSVLALLEKEVV